MFEAADFLYFHFVWREYLSSWNLKEIALSSKFAFVEAAPNDAS